MEINNTSKRIHPLVAAAAVAVMLVSLVGVAAITGIIPTSHSSAAPAATAPAAATLAPTASAEAKTAADHVVNLPANPVTAPTTHGPAAQAPHAAPTTHGPAAQAPHAAKTAPPQQHTAQHSEPGYVAQAPKICDNCGSVESVQAIQQAAQPSGLGVVAGAVLGGVLGNQVGGGNGKTLATVAGAVGGGYAGNEVEKRTRTATAYQVRVRMENGTVRTFPYNSQPNWNVGDRIKVVNGYLTSQS